jgi:hypothetical protein
MEEKTSAFFSSSRWERTRKSTLKGWMVSLSCPRTTHLFIMHQEMTGNEKKKERKAESERGLKCRNWVVTTSLLFRPYSSSFDDRNDDVYLIMSRAYYYIHCRVSLDVERPLFFVFPSFFFRCVFIFMFLAKEVVTWLDIIRQVKRQVHDLTEENGDWRAEKSTR